jgi:hypothetical protein
MPIQWKNTNAGIGAGIDSFYEYLFKVCMCVCTNYFYEYLHGVCVCVCVCARARVWDATCDLKWLRNFRLHSVFTCISFPAVSLSAGVHVFRQHQVSQFLRGGRCSRLRVSNTPVSCLQYTYCVSPTHPFRVSNAPISYIQHTYFVPSSRNRLSVASLLMHARFHSHIHT